MTLFTLPQFHGISHHKIAYVNARLLDPASKLDVQGGVLCDGGVIADFGTHIQANSVPEGCTIIDCKGHVLCAGLLDIQVHFREPGFEYKETLETGSKSAAAGGVILVACMPNTKPVIDDPSLVQFLQKKAEESAYIRVKTYASISKAMKGEELTEMALLVESGAVGFTDDGLPLMNAQLMRQALSYSSMLGVPIAQHAEDLTLSCGGCMNEGEVSAKLGLRGIPNAAEAVMVARDILLTELTGGQYHVLHISTKEAVELVRQAKKKGLNVTCEAAPHHFTLTDHAVEAHGTLSKMNPPLRAEQDRLAIIEGLCDGTIDAIATDHAPHDPDSKCVPMDDATFGIVGLETMLPISLTHLYHSGKMPLMDVIAAMTYKPADIIHVPAGRIKKGAPADLTLFNLDLEWTISPSHFQSKSKNSPYANARVKGKAVRTIIAGQSVFFDENAE